MSKIQRFGKIVIRSIRLISLSRHRLKNIANVFADHQIGKTVERCLIPVDNHQFCAILSGNEGKTRRGLNGQ